MDSIKDILTRFQPTEDKYISREFQSFGVFLAEKLGDEKHKALYIKYAKEIPRPILEQAYRFVIDSKARNKAALFMWKLRELKVFDKFKLTPARKKTANKFEKFDDSTQEKTPKVTKPRAKKKKQEESLF